MNDRLSIARVVPGVLVAGKTGPDFAALKIAPHVERYLVQALPRQLGELIRSCGEPDKPLILADHGFEPRSGDHEKEPTRQKKLA